MKPHIKLTIDELQAHQALLQNMIQALEAYGQSAEVLAPTAPAQPVQSRPAPAAVARVSAATKRRPPSGAAKGKGVRALVATVVRQITPCSTAMVRDFIREKYPIESKGIGASSYGTALHSLRKGGVLDKRNGMWCWRGNGEQPSAKEAQYREFRETVATTGPARIDELPSNGD